MVSIKLNYMNFMVLALFWEYISEEHYIKYNKDTYIYIYKPGSIHKKGIYMYIIYVCVYV